MLIAFTMISFYANAQIDYSWWNKIHNWDGVTSWQNYLTIAPAFLGPNALPVPDVSKALLDSIAQVEIGGDLHFNSGDKTQDVFLRGYFPFKDQKVAVGLEVIPIEYFQTDTIIRDNRASRGKSGKGKAGGDIYFTTFIQLLKNKVSLPDVALRAALRTASGTNLGEARYTDGPGYYFDLSAGKNVKLKSDASIRLYGMIGFYVYQTFDILHLQNDCLLYGGGIDLSVHHFVLSEELGGYNGYMEDGDKPLVFRSALMWNSKSVGCKLSYQHAIRDFPSDRIRLSIILKLKSITL